MFTIILLHSFYTTPIKRKIQDEDTCISNKMARIHTDSELDAAIILLTTMSQKTNQITNYV